MSELKPCPFCGGAPKYWNGGTGIIECTKCSASIEGHGDEWNARARNWIKCEGCGKLMPQTGVPAEKAWCSDECVKAEAPAAPVGKMERMAILKTMTIEELGAITWDDESKNKPLIMQIRDNLNEWADVAKGRAKSIEIFQPRVKGLVEALELGLMLKGGWREAIVMLEDYCSEPVRLKNMIIAADQLDKWASDTKQALAQWSGKTG